MPKIHHTAICTDDVETSLRFWRDGLGFAEMMDEHFDGDWPTLLDAPGTRLRSVFLGDPTDWDGGIIELVDLGPPHVRAEAPATTPVGFLLVSLFCAVEPTLGQLADLGLGGEPRRITASGIDMAVVRDPNGVAVELIEPAAAVHLAALGGD